MPTIRTGRPVTGERAASALYAFIDMMVASAPGAWARPSRTGARLVSSGSALSTFNGVFPTVAEASPQDVAEFAALGHPQPWSVFCRDEPSQVLLDAAAAHGLTSRHRSPVLGWHARPIPPDTGLGRVTVRRVDGSGSARYVSALAAGFGLPGDLFTGIMSAPVLDSPGVSAYLVEDAGEPVATALGFLAEGVAGVFNVATVSSARRRGHGRLATRAVLRDAVDAGADGAYLISSKAGLPLYTGMGFQHLEYWTYVA